MIYIENENGLYEVSGLKYHAKRKGYSKNAEIECYVLIGIIYGSTAEVEIQTFEKEEDCAAALDYCKRLVRANMLLKRDSYIDFANLQNIPESNESDASKGKGEN
ncbi:hypothetical protein [Breznakia pachnodae]|uniref:Phage protein n=1 Tax=Breznakia pachnodae TaxID=265178 RepID=A0ABU0E6H5_9FIRM|nr:hypothetical protein [Breznakia pachnodae]MDQ0362502.1 hypothetical protein [Breznakia pachnodae]